MQAITLASLIALGTRFVSFLKYLRAKDWNSVATQAASWASGVAIVFLAGAADITNRLILFPGVPTLSDINAASKVMLGLMLMSLGSEVYQFKKAFDRTDSAAEPALLPPAKVVTAEGEAVDATDVVSTPVVPPPAKPRTRTRKEAGAVALSTTLFVVSLVAAFLLGYILRAIGVGA